MRRLTPVVHAAVRQAGGGEPQRITASHAQPVAPSSQDIPHLIDQTLLKAEVTPAQVEALCDEARTYRFAVLCVPPIFVRLAARKLQGSGVAVGSVAGFPLGADFPAVKALQAQIAIDEGASEIDMVLAIGRLISGDFAGVAEDLLAVTRLAHARGALVKLVFETPLLSDELKVAACLLAMQSGIDFVKTATGLAGGGATVEDVALMRSVVGDRLGVKAAGGIRSLDDARRMIAAGANRLGTSHGVAIAHQILGASSAGGAVTGY
jgi:deoxyribose-phosphate aldolase